MVKVRVVRRLSPGEVADRISKYGRKLKAGSFSNHQTEVRGVAAEEKLARSEWRELMQAYQAYEEGGELDYVVEEDLTMGSQTLEKVFTEKRLELAIVMGQKEFASISELANHLGRDIKNTYEDLHILRKAGIVRLAKTHKNVQPKLLIDGISLIFR
jgi:predicted transcriptional regulator